MPEKEKAPRQLELFTDDGMRSPAPKAPKGVELPAPSPAQAIKAKLKRVPGPAPEGYVASYELEGKTYAAKPIQKGGNDILKLGIFEIQDQGEQIAVEGSLTVLSTMDRSLFMCGRYEDSSRYAVISYGLRGDYVERTGNGFASRMAELLIEAASARGITRIFGRLPKAETYGRLDPEKEASRHILHKLGFRHVRATHEDEVVALGLS